MKRILFKNFPFVFIQLMLVLFIQKGIIAQEIQIQSDEPVQKIEEWGHDIKQGYHADRLTVQACQQIFQDSRFNILRIPVYCNAHKSDGSLRRNYLVETAESVENEAIMQWQKVSAEGEWFYLLNKAHEKYLKGWGDDDVELADTNNQGSWTQWRMIDAGDGWYHIESKGHEKYLRSSGTDVHLEETSSTGGWTRWKFLDAGDDWFRIESKGHQNYLSGGGSEYDKIIEAINRAKENGRPGLFASVKIYWPEDASTGRNETWGPFLNEDGLLDASRYASACDAYMDHIQEETGQTVDYLAPVCEQTGAVPTTRFRDAAEALKHDPLIVGPEKWGVQGSQQYWDSVLRETVDVRSTHNKDYDWVPEAIYDWNGETKGGREEEFINFFKELNQSVYEGQVEAVVLWADWHLNNTEDDNRNGPFRRELVEASAYHPVNTTIADKDAEAVAMAFQTGTKNKLKVFYSGLNDVTFNFAEKIDESSLPEEAFGVSGYSFSMPATGDQDYRSFTFEMADDPSSIQQTGLLSLNIYPNPSATGQITIEASNLPGTKRIAIFSLTGSRLYQGSFNSQKTSIHPGLSSGVYLVEVGNEQQSMVKKITVYQ